MLENTRTQSLRIESQNAKTVLNSKPLLLVTLQKRLELEDETKMVKTICIHTY